MVKRKDFVFLAAILGLILVGAQSEKSFAKDKKLEPEELVAEHLKSLGSPEALAAIKTRILGGTTTLKFILGATGQLVGNAQVVSEKGKMGIVLRYGSKEYPGEHFAFNGEDVSIGLISPGQRSPLGLFLYQNNGPMKNELLGGVLAVGWPLLNVEESQAKIKYDKTEIEGREFHELEYRPKKHMGDIKVKMYFDLETFHHVMTEYRLRQRLQDGFGNTIFITKVLLEKFDDFREVDGLTLPHSYTIDYSQEGAGSSFLGRWNIQAEKLGHNGNIDPQFYNAVQ